MTTFQCGAFLEQLETPAQLSRSTVSCLIGLHHLHTLQARSDPRLDPVVPSDIFASLETLTLDGGVGQKWPSFLGASENGMKVTLANLHYLGGTTVDPDFISFLRIFQKLARKEGGCTFLLTDDYVTRLANALKSLRLGSLAIITPTPFSLLTISARHLKLKTLGVHFNTTNIGHVLDRLFKQPRYEMMCSLLRCPVHYLAVADTQIPTRDPGTTFLGYSTACRGSVAAAGNWSKPRNTFGRCVASDRRSRLIL